jgi:hypothetical protein
VIEEYREIIQYLDGMKVPIGATKEVWTHIVHKSQNYLVRGDQLYFLKRDGVLRWAIKKGEVLSEIRSNKIFLWTSLYLILDIIQNCFW